MAKLRLLKRFNRQVPGDIVEIAKEADAKVLRLLGIAEDFVEGRKGRTSTRDMRPEQTTTTTEQKPPAPEQQSSHPVPAMSTDENKDAPTAPPTQENVQQDAGNGGFGNDRYSRRDMQPKE